MARRAELAEQSAVVAKGISSPTPELVARLGGRPAHGQNRRSWDAQAEALVGRWAATLEPSRAERFWALIEHIPRQRAAAGVHALIAAGVDPAVLYRALSELEQDTAKAGPAILDYRVKDLVRLYRVDASAYHLAEPLTGAGEWDRVHRLLDTAEIWALSRRDLGDLCAERRDLLRLVGDHPSPTAEPTAPELSSARPALTRPRRVGMRSARRSLPRSTADAPTGRAPPT